MSALRAEADEVAPRGSVPRNVSRERNGVRQDVRDDIAEEVPVAFAYNGVPFAVMMATPADIEDFAIGFAVSEGIVECASDVHVERIDSFVEGIQVELRIPPGRQAMLDARRRGMSGRSGCGVCGSELLEATLRQPAPVADGMAITSVILQRALHALRGAQPLAHRTGATHAAGWADATGALLLVREDVGRHNALDKLIGAMRRAGVDATRGFAVVTSRASYEMAMKAASAGMPLLAAISAPTALAIALAEQANLTLVGFARDDGHAVYTHAWRLPGAGSWGDTVKQDAGP